MKVKYWSKKLNLRREKTKNERRKRLSWVNEEKEDEDQKEEEEEAIGNNKKRG